MSWVFCFHCLHVFPVGRKAPEFHVFFLHLGFNSTLLKRQNRGGALPAHPGMNQCIHKFLLFKGPLLHGGKIIITMQTRKPWFAWKWSAATVVFLQEAKIYVVIICDRRISLTPPRSLLLLLTKLLLPHSTKKKSLGEQRAQQETPRASNLPSDKEDSDWASAAQAVGKHSVVKGDWLKGKGKDKGKGKGKSKGETGNWHKSARCLFFGCNNDSCFLIGDLG